MFKKILLTFLLFLAFVLIGVIYIVIVSPDDVSNRLDTDFQGPPAGEVPSFDGPTSSPPEFDTE